MKCLKVRDIIITNILKVKVKTKGLSYKCRHYLHQAVPECFYLYSCNQTLRVILCYCCTKSDENRATFDCKYRGKPELSKVHIRPSSGSLAPVMNNKIHLLSRWAYSTQQHTFTGQWVFYRARAEKYSKVPSQIRLSKSICPAAQVSCQA